MGEPITDFINAQKEGTQRTYKTLLKLFIEWTKENGLTSGRQILESKRQDKTFIWEKKILEFHNWILERGKSENYAKTVIGCVRGFFAYHREPLKFRRLEGKRLSEANRITEDYLFDKTDLEKMVIVGNLKEKYVTLVGKSIGLRASDFIRLTYGRFRALKLDTEAPIFIGETATVKERVKAFPFLDSDAVPIVKAMLEANPQAKNEDRILTIDEEELTTILQTLAKKTNIQHGDRRIRFHCLRKYLIDRLSAYASESQWKQIVGKKIDEKAYVSTEQLKQIYKRAMKDIAITNGNGLKIQRVAELENAVKQLETENMALRTRQDLLQTDFQSLRETVEKLYPKEVKRYILNEDNKIEERIETFNTPEDYIESEQNFLNELATRQHKKRK